MTVVGVRATAAVLLMAGAWSLYVASAASASTTNGTATIVDPSSNSPLASGGSATSFTVSLPAQAACSGDTATGGYQVESYLVPQGTSPTSITFTGGVPSTGYGFFSSSGTLYGPANTAVTTGQIISIPDFEWGPAVQSYSLLSTLVASGGVWEAGIACTNSGGTLTDWWNTEVTFTASTSDADGFTWSAVAGLPGSTATSTTTTTTSGSATTTTSTPGSTTTTTSGSTTTTTFGSTTTTTSGSGSTTTTTVSAATLSGSSTGGDPTSTGDPAATAATSGTLASTGAPVVRDLALGLLCVGLGLILMGWSATSRWARAAVPIGGLR